MTCEHVIMPGGGTAIACSSRRRQRCACGSPATLLCDWKTRTKRGTCSKPICSVCATSAAPEKDLCPAHARAFEQWKADRARRELPPRGSAERRPSALHLPIFDAPAPGPLISAAARVSHPETAPSNHGASPPAVLAISTPETPHVY